MIRFTTIGTGTFYCPRCRVTRGYEQRKARRYFALYFIPLFPIGDLGEVVQCNGCASQFKPGILHLPPPPSPADEARMLFLRVMLLLPHRNGRLDQREQDVAVRAYREETGRDLSPQVIYEELERLDRELDLIRYVKNVARTLSDLEKEKLIRAAWRIGVADDTLSEVDQAALNELADALAISDGHLAQILGRLEKEVAAT